MIQSHPTLQAGQPQYTATESAAGIAYSGEGFAPGQAFVLWLREPGSDQWQAIDNATNDQHFADDQGRIAGSAYTYVGGEKAPFAAGEYTLKVSQAGTQGMIEATSTFTVVPDSGSTPPASSRPDQPSGEGTGQPGAPAEPGQPGAWKPQLVLNEAAPVPAAADAKLARTGIDGGGVAAALGLGLVLSLAGGAIVLLVRRRQHAPQDPAKTA